MGIRTERLGRIAAIVLALGFPFLGCDGERERPNATPVTSVPRAETPSVFLIVVDAASAAYFGVYGDPHATSPTIDAFAQDAIVFENAYSQSATTTASSVSLLTGVRGTTHLMTGQNILPEQFRTAAERFRSHGYRTYGFIGNPFAGAPELGLDRGYDFFAPIYALAELQDKRASEGSTGFKVTLPGDLNAAVFANLDRFSVRGTFAYLHYLQPHKPYDAPAHYTDAIRPSDARCRCSGAACPCGTASWRSLSPLFDAGNATGEASAGTIEHLKARYRANLRYLDDGLDELFRRLRTQGLWEESVVVLTSDHGDAFFKHRRFGHNRTLYDDMVRIPMIIKFPTSQGVTPRRIPNLIESVDVLPTLFDSLGLPIPRCFEGESFWPLISAEGGELPRDEVILATNRRDLHAIRQGSEKYLVSADGSEELYDLAGDPDEQHNIVEKRPERAAALRRRLDSVVDLASTDALPSDNSLREDPEMNALLESLGYLEKDAPALSGKGESLPPRVCTD